MTTDPTSPTGQRGLPLSALLHQRLVRAVLVLIVITVTTLGLGGAVLLVFMPKVARADAMLAALQDGHVAMVDQETALRGFLVTRDEQFLQPYRLGAADLDATNVALEGWVDGDPALASSIARLQADEETWTTDWAEPLLGSPPAPTDTDRLSALLLEGKQLFDAYRTTEAQVRSELETGR